MKRKSITLLLLLLFFCSAVANGYSEIAQEADLKKQITALKIANVELKQKLLKAEKENIIILKKNREVIRDIKVIIAEKKKLEQDCKVLLDAINNSNCRDNLDSVTIDKINKIESCFIPAPASTNAD